MIDHAELWDSATRCNDRPRPLESARCSLCGIELPKGLMMPDGGGACADVRWYCKDTRSCTDRWTARPDQAPAPQTAEPGETAKPRDAEESTERVSRQAERSRSSGGA